VKRVPNSQGVIKALRVARVASQKSLKGLNRVASQKMVKGDYAAAEVLAGKGKEIRQFQLEIEALRKRWRELCGAGDRAGKHPDSPLWLYFQPILQALVQAGGECRRVGLEGRVGSLMSSSLQQGDRETLAHGRDRWRVMIQRARKHLVAEGWIEDCPGPVWRITDAGRKAAEKPIGKDLVAIR
jgi:Mrr N-terminal domain